MLDTAPARGGSAKLAALLGTIGLHAVIVAGASIFGVRGVVELARALPATEMVEVDLPPPPKPAAPEPPPKPELVPRAKAISKPAEPEPPSAAQAAQVLDTKSEVMDFGDEIVVGTGDRYAGGVTDSSGTSKSAVTDARARGDNPRPLAPKPTPAVDLSRPPRLAGGASWQCPFPPEADDEGIDRAVVGLRVEIASDGSVRSVSATRDPGSGFGRAARRCASSKRWSAALDRDGRATAGIAIVNVTFQR